MPLTWIDSHRFATAAMRVAAVATNSYVATPSEECFWFDRVALFISYTKGSSTSVEISPEISDDGTAWRRYTSTDTNASTGSVVTNTIARDEFTYTHSGSLSGDVDNIVLDLYDLTLLPLTSRFFRVNVKVTGTATASSVTVDAFFHKVATISELEGLHYATNY